jgi:hypothetical protein
MTPVDFPVRRVGLGELGGAVDHQQILCVFLLRSPGEIKTPSDDRGLVDHHDLVVGDGIGTVVPDWKGLVFWKNLAFK